MSIIRNNELGCWWRSRHSAGGACEIHRPGNALPLQVEKIHDNGQRQRHHHCGKKRPHQKYILLAAECFSPHAGEKVITLLFLIFLKKTHSSTSDCRNHSPSAAASPIFISRKKRGSGQQRATNCRGKINTALKFKEMALIKAPRESMVSLTGGGYKTTRSMMISNTTAERRKRPLQTFFPRFGSSEDAHWPHLPDELDTRLPQ